MDQRVIDLYNVYIQRGMLRRNFLRRLAGTVGSTYLASLPHGVSRIIAAPRRAPDASSRKQD
jgi:hypothetical protein